MEKKGSKAWHKYTDCHTFDKLIQSDRFVEKDEMVRTREENNKVEQTA